MNMRIGKPTRVGSGWPVRQYQFVVPLGTSLSTFTVELSGMLLDQDPPDKPGLRKNRATNATVEVLCGSHGIRKEPCCHVRIDTSRVVPNA